MRKIIIAIDGHSSCGKSSTAKLVATRLGYLYIDTGAMYRAVTLYLIRNGIKLSDFDGIKLAMQDVHISFQFVQATGRNELFLNGENVEDEIRKMYVSENVSKVSALPEVRKVMIDQQRRLGMSKGLVIDGRDIGTVVFPEAELKIFMTADSHVRAQRRQAELLSSGEAHTLARIAENLSMRDQLDTNREESPLRQAQDAIYMDNSNISLAEQVETIIELALDLKGLC